MILKMSKVEIIGPSSLLDDVLFYLIKKENIQLEKNDVTFINNRKEIKKIGQSESEENFAKRLFLEKQKTKLEELLSLLPKAKYHERYLNPEGALHSLSKLLERHLAICRENTSAKNFLIDENKELQKHILIIEEMLVLMQNKKETENFEYIGITLKDLIYEKELRELLDKTANGFYELFISKPKNGNIIGLILVLKEKAEPVRKILSGGKIPEYKFPALIEKLPLKEKLEPAKRRISEIEKEIKNINLEMQNFTDRWASLYSHYHEWIREKLSAIRAYFSIYRSRMCFFIFGWMSSKSISQTRKELEEKYNGKVVLEELSILKEDIEKIPVILKNPKPIKPFEIFTKLLPLPSYYSYDPTPFLAIFFPLLFGLILGDVGYGLIIFLISLFTIYKYKERKFICDLAKILMYSSIYTIIFGFLYGELFGDIGHIYFHLKPILIDRRLEVLPMMIFSVSLGFVHIFLGTILGLVADIKRRNRHEILAKIFSLGILSALAFLALSLSGVYPNLPQKTIVVFILIFSFLLIITGGILAPLEFIKNIGNIISYVRIMAIGLASVLLAYTANKMSGLAGNVALGVLGAFILHLLNLILGVFSPAIHALRLHYVEFFSKFIESGGKKFDPLKKE
ncbi:MAG: ATPase [Spirochaetia bacterium]|nr:ATPase [Spirochaetia bacterium]